MKQTSIDWLVDQLIPKDQHEGILDIVEEAKEMNKEEILNIIKFLRTQDKIGKSVNHLYEQYCYTQR